MNSQEMVTMIMGEEASEVAQMCSKINRFGMDEVFPDPVNNAEGLTNKQRTHKEIDDLMGMVEMLNRDFDFGYVPNPTARNAKQIKVMKYLNYSRDLGTLKD